MRAWWTLVWRTLMVDSVQVVRLRGEVEAKGKEAGQLFEAELQAMWAEAPIPL